MSKFGLNPILSQQWASCGHLGRLSAEALMLENWHINDTQMSFIRPQT